MKNLAIKMITMYKSVLSPFLRPSCRYYPTCSKYTIDAIEKYGPAKGLIKGFLRLLRCNQLFAGGFDPLK